MFENMLARVTRFASRRARARDAELTERAAGELPGSVAAELVEGGVQLSGRGLERRFALDPILRASIWRLVK